MCRRRRELLPLIANACCVHKHYAHSTDKSPAKKIRLFLALPWFAENDCGLGTLNLADLWKRLQISFSPCLGVDFAVEHTLTFPCQGFPTSAATFGAVEMRRKCGGYAGDWRKGENRKLPKQGKSTINILWIAQAREFALKVGVTRPPCAVDVKPSARGDGDS